MFSKYFLSELAYLREMGRAFGLANPGVAGMLVERGADPDVERLLEGFAFLTARIRERVDDDVPEMVHVLTDLLLPHYLRPVPASTVIEFTPQVKALRGRAHIPAGAEIAARPLDGTSCIFRTTSDVDLLPLTLEEALLDKSSVTAPVLRLFFQAHEQISPEIFRPEGLRLFIHAELATSALMLLWLLRYCRGVQVNNDFGKSVQLGPRAIHPLGFDRNFRLLPWPRSSEGYRQLQEYFTLPEKFLFFEVRGLEAARHIATDRFELAFQFERPPPLEARVGQEMFRLYCAPAINLFSASAHPLRHSVLSHDQLLRAEGVEPRHMEVFSVDSVVGLQAGANERRNYRPFFEFAHAAGDGAEPSFYRLRRTASPIDDGIDTYLSLETPRDVMPSIEEETLSIELTCTHRSLATRLQVGDVHLPTITSPTNARFKNISPVCRPARAPLGTELHWRLLSHLAVNQQSLSDVEVLRRLLELYNFKALTDDLAARATRLRINAIRSVEVRPGTRFLEGSPLRGNRVTVALDETNFLGAGDAFLFGCILDELFASNVTLNSFNELGIRLQPSQLEYSWPPRNGSQLTL
jgi:type VI secretion system protein ImpG